MVTKTLPIVKRGRIYGTKKKKLAARLQRLSRRGPLRDPWNPAESLVQTDARAPKGLAPIAIGLGLTLVHLNSIPNTSVNPARSTGGALCCGEWALSQLWAFWVAPMIGAALAGLVCKVLAEAPVLPVPLAEAKVSEATEP